MDFYKIFTSISELRPTWGAFVWIAFGLVWILSVLKQGKEDVLIKFQAVFMAFVLMKSAPLFMIDFKKLKLEQSWAELAIFLVAFVLISIFLAKTSFSLISKSRSTLVGTIALSFVFTGLLIAISVSLFPENLQKGLGDWINLVFIKDPSGLIWALASIIFILLIG